jgi:cytidine deaminase
MTPQPLFAVLSARQVAEIQATMRGAGGILPAAAVSGLVAAGISMEQLMLDLIPLAKQYAIPPISSFFVGAVGLGRSGNLYLGANLEFTGEALSFCVHAEQAVTAQAISFGDTGLDMLAVSAAPCGYCRQFLYELTTASTLKVLLPNAPPAPLTNLLPAAFGPVSLGVTAALMSPQAHDLTLDSPETDPVVHAALSAAIASYAPYSFSYSGVALETSDGRIYSGSYAENAAFNPSMSPLEAALVSLVIRGGKTYADIRDAVLVEVAAARASQAGVTRLVLGSVSSVPLRLRSATMSSTTLGKDANSG